MKDIPGLLGSLLCYALAMDENFIELLKKEMEIWNEKPESLSDLTLESWRQYYDEMV